jgi:hypothetical protein
VPPRPGVSQDELVSELIDAHNCWTSGPAPCIPGRAIVEVHGAAVCVDAKVGFAIWLGPDGVPATGDELPGRVYAFCP